MRHFKIVAIPATLVSLLLLSTTPVMAGGSSTSSGLAPHGTKLILGSFNPVHHMRATGAHQQAVRRHHRWLRLKHRIAVRVARERRAAAAREAALAARQAAGTSSTRPGVSPAGGAPSSSLQAIAQCESGGNPAAISPDGQYRGKYQFTLATWASVGGSGDPAAAPEAEQDARAAQLYAQAGAGQWPVCGR